MLWHECLAPLPGAAQHGLSHESTSYLRGKGLFGILFWLMPDDFLSKVGCLPLNGQASHFAG